MMMAVPSHTRFVAASGEATDWLAWIDMFELLSPIHWIGWHGLARIGWHVDWAGMDFA